MIINVKNDVSAFLTSLFMITAIDQDIAMITIPQWFMVNCIYMIDSLLIHQYVMIYFKEKSIDLICLKNW